MKKINFVLPPNLNKPVGGYKIVYQYANELVSRGYDVSITYLFSDKMNKYLATILSNVDRKIYNYSLRKFEVTWFNLNPKIKLYYNAISERHFPDADYVVATAMRTTAAINGLSSQKGKKYYFIQDYETERFGNKREDVEKSYNLGFENIVISKELYQIVLKATNQKPNYLPNFYNPEEFYLYENLENRENIISLLSHYSEIKRTEFGLEILREVRKEIPGLKVELFGAHKPTYKLDNNVCFTYNATTKQLREDIYSKSKIYLLPSTREGWGLTGLEAMASGATLVASRIGGIEDYATVSNACLVRPDSKKEFIDKIIYLLKNEDERLALSKKALEDVGNFSIMKSTDKLVEILEGN
ncbi:glycosyltransferase family 4 protein [Lactococcus petauri]|uniref:glycosyltransferase family 4 protein n=1 Tax=Lactococcus petauri TaxID=1940789 RepID=UPI0022E5A29A|nr:glycosyltransferase family 4 protein [Lactococcus petauri]